MLSNKILTRIECSSFANKFPTGNYVLRGEASLKFSHQTLPGNYVLRGEASGLDTTLQTEANRIALMLMGGERVAVQEVQEKAEDRKGAEKEAEKGAANLTDDVKRCICVRGVIICVRGFSLTNN